MTIVAFGLIIAGCLPVVPPTEQNEPGTLPNKASGEVWNVPGDYSTIQDAINAATGGETIIVAAGTYLENVVIPSDKDGLQLLGAGSGVTIIAPTSGRAVELNPAADRPMDGVRIKGFTLVTYDENYKFITISSLPDCQPYTTNLTLEDIVVDGGERGICLNATRGVDFINVHISNITGIWEDGALELTGVFDLTFTDGSITGNNIGVQVQSTDSGEIGDGYGPNGNIEIHNSSLTDNANFAILNLQMGFNIEATCNWWGDMSGPSYEGGIGSGDTISDPVANIHFIPWLLSPNGSCCSFEEIINGCVDANNRGQFVSCVVRQINELLKSGEITTEEKDAMMSWVKKSNIGKKITHTAGNIYVVVDGTEPEQTGHFAFYAYETEDGTTNGYFALCSENSDVPYIIANVLCCNVVDENTALFAWGSDEMGQWNVAKVIDNGNQMCVGYYNLEDEAFAAVDNAEEPLNGEVTVTITGGNLEVYYYGD